MLNNFRRNEGILYLTVHTEGIIKVGELWGKFI